MSIVNYKLPRCECGVEMSILHLDFRDDNKHLEVGLKCQNCGSLKSVDYKQESDDE